LTLHLTKLQKQLCNALQNGLPICARPFAEIAKDLNTSEEEVLQQTRKLKSAGIIRRIGAILNYRALGIKSTLVAAHVPQKNLQEVVKSVNSLEGVSHNYLRTHYYNLWFTLQAQTAEQINSVLAGLSGRFGIDFHSLPVQRIFKLDVRFDIESDSETLLQDVEEVPPCFLAKARRGVELDENQKSILSKLQDDLDVTAEPFAFLCSQVLGAADVVRIITQLSDKGVIRRVAGVVDHRKLGFTGNVLFAGEVPQNRVIEMGKKLARLRIVTHCYERKTFEGWPYNLFAMMHGRSIDRIQRVINKFTEAEGISSFQLLPTAAELKKQPVKHKFY
jgi:DNA-binding Lrp family transcriptional regulator